MLMMAFAGTGKSLIIQVNQQAGLEYLGEQSFFSNYIGALIAIPLNAFAIKRLKFNVMIWMSSFS